MTITADVIILANRDASVNGTVTIRDGRTSSTDAGVIITSMNSIVDGAAAFEGTMWMGGGYGNMGVTITDAGITSVDGN